MTKTKRVAESLAVPVCVHCQRQATCIGVYENAENYAPACDDCCGHGNEDGVCVGVDDDLIETLLATLNGTRADLRAAESAATPTDAEAAAKAMKAAELAVVDANIRHVEMSPGAGASECAYAIAALNDVRAHVETLPVPHE